MKLWEGYVFTAFCDSVHRGSASVHAGIPPPPLDQAPPRTRAPKVVAPHEQTPPGADTPHTLAPPLCTVHAGRYNEQAGGMHPTGMQSCYCLAYMIVKGPFTPSDTIAFASATAILL